MPTQEQKILACVSHYKKLVHDLPEPPQSMSQAPNARLDVVLRRVGAKRRSKALLARLDRAFRDEGIATFPPLTDEQLEYRDRVYMFDANHSVVGLASRHELVSDEKKLQYLVTAFRERLTQLRGLTDWDSQFRFSSKRKIDVLALRPRRKQLVGIELKTSALDHRAGGQLLDYVDDLAKLAKARGLNSAHLIVVSGQPDPVVRSRVEAHAKTRKVTVEFLLYRVEMKLIPHP